MSSQVKLQEKRVNGKEMQIIGFLQPLTIDIKVFFDTSQQI